MKRKFTIHANPDRMRIIDEFARIVKVQTRGEFMEKCAWTEVNRHAAKMDIVAIVTSIVDRAIEKRLPSTVNESESILQRFDEGAGI